jgi:hypothetical protein
VSTYTPIASQTLSSAAASVTFSGIPQTYTDLVVVINGSMSASGATIYARLNGDTGSNYSVTYIGGNGTSAYSNRSSNNSNGIGLGGFEAGFSTGMFTNIVHFQNYSNSTTNKTVLSRWSDPSSGGEVEAFVGLWRNTTAITSIEIRNNGGHNFNSGSTFNLYGIDASLSAQAKATGGTSIYTDGTYWYHIFNQSGTFTPSVALSNVDYLVVAGGGGGGTNSAGFGGGGGAGGLRCTVTSTGGGGSLESKLSLTAQAYTVTVGAGGAASTNGNDSVFSTVTSTGGGRGGVATSGSGATGGSGGGGAENGSGGSNTANQGYAGGTGNGGSTNGGGGGGGAGAAGSAASGGGGNGGNGVATSISSSSVTYAGGGAGGCDAGTRGTGGSGGGGAGADLPSTAAVVGTANSGSGGGGGVTSLSGAAGGSGIIVIRYSAA